LCVLRRGVAGWLAQYRADLARGASWHAWHLNLKRMWKAHIPQPHL